MIGPFGYPPYVRAFRDPRSGKRQVHLLIRPPDIIVTLIHTPSQEDQMHQQLVGLDLQGSVVIFVINRPFETQ